jgi:hypothetical protein
VGEVGLVLGLQLDLVAELESVSFVRPAPPPPIARAATTAPI